MASSIVKKPNPAGLLTIVGLTALLGVLVWAYLPILRVMVDRWSFDPRYTHGYLVPAFAVVLLWLRRGQLAVGELSPSWWGVLILAGAALIRLAAAYVYNDWLDAASMIISLAGVVTLAGGWPALRWAWPAIAFLFFMVPLPFRLELALGWPLQRIATIISAYVLQTLGFAALGEGNIIQMTDSTIGVVEACSGLSMMILFFAISTGFVMLIDRPLVDKLIIVASAIPIALVVNILRIVVTGMLNETFGEKIGNLVFHDLAGWLMMPTALLLLGAELWFLTHLFVEVEREPVGEPVFRGGAGFVAARTGRNNEAVG